MDYRGKLTVALFRAWGEDLKYKTPSIGVYVHDNRVLELTWDEANNLARALQTVAGIGENG